MEIVITSVIRKDGHSGLAVGKFDSITKAIEYLKSLK